jgi:hypothetical protein
MMSRMKPVTRERSVMPPTVRIRSIMRLRPVWLIAGQPLAGRPRQSGYRGWFLE